jgi:uncharacterized protein YjlB
MDDGMLKTSGKAMKLAVALDKEAQFVPGRRSFFRYRELGVTEATGGRMRAQVTSAVSAMDRETGWHYHTCEMQFVYILGGWIDLEFPDTGVVRFVAGDSVMIPGGLPHQELRTSEDFKLVEVSVPAEMGTVSCDKPA